MTPVNTTPAAPDDEAGRTADARLRVGTTLHGKWHLDSLIAVGGMGAVYEATHRNGMRGAVKVLDPLLGRSTELRGRFLREGKLANLVRHEGVVQVLDDDETEDGNAYLVMELLHGSTLETLSARTAGKLQVVKVVEYGLQVLETLEVAAASGVVHRDIKPDNLFLTNEGVVKVLDFGIAGMLVQDGSKRVTRSGESFGTPAFMSPEQARGRWELVDHQSDLYSLGATLFTLLTGQIVYAHAGTAAELLVLAIIEDPRSLRLLIPDAPEPLVRAVDGALKRNKSERWLDAAEMRASLEEAHAALTGAPATVARIDSTLPPVCVSPNASRAALAPTVAAVKTPISKSRLFVIAAAAAVVGLVMFESLSLSATSAAATASPAPLVEHDAAEPPASLSAPPSAPIAALAPPVAVLPRIAVAPSASAPAKQTRYGAVYDRRH